MKYKLIIKTNCYAGNFERELCAFMTGQTGECGVGSEFIEDEITDKFQEIINQKSDEHGCYRPVSICDDNSNNLQIYLSQLLTKEEFEFLDNRAKLFEKERPYEYLDKNFKYLGIHMYEENTTIKEIYLNDK